MPAALQPLLDFLSRSPTPFHAVANLGVRLEESGFRRLAEGDDWGGLDEGRYFVTRNDSSLIAFNWSGSADHGFRMVGAHTDSPCLKVKPEAISESEGYARLALEVYGGALLAPWFDRDLGLAGRVTYRDREGRIGNVLVDFDRPVAFIPSLAIHLDRGVNENRSINRQNDLPALLCTMDDGEPGFPTLLENQLDAQGTGGVSRILGFELSLYDRQPAAVVGLGEEFIASARLDNLLSCFAATEALVAGSTRTNALIVLSDHEEVGSGSASGAEGPFLRDVLGRICGDGQALSRAVSRSMLVSADNAHGVHPNYPDKHEPAHRPRINAGPVIKINHNQRYATNSETEALFRHVCEESGVPVQTIVVRSDMGCGSTIGPVTAARLGVRTVDIGIPQLGMHSIRELAGVKDQDFLLRALEGFFGCSPWPF